MANKNIAYERVRHILRRAGAGPLDPGDTAVVRSMVGEFDETDVEGILKEFFDVEPVTLALYNQFQDNGASWGVGVRQTLAESLLFCGRDEEAQSVLATL